jgi:hypothetical protein
MAIYPTLDSHRSYCYLLGIIVGFVGHELLLTWIGNLVTHNIAYFGFRLFGLLMAVILLSGFSGPSLVQLRIFSIKAIRQ